MTLKEYLKKKKAAFREKKEKRAEARQIKRLVKEEDIAVRAEERAAESKVIEAKLERQKTAQTQIKKTETLRTELQPQSRGMGAAFGRHLQGAAKVGGRMRESAGKLEISRPPKKGTSMFGGSMDVGNIGAATGGSMFGSSMNIGAGGNGGSSMGIDSMFGPSPKKKSGKRKGKRKGKKRQRSKQEGTIFDI